MKVFDLWKEWQPIAVLVCLFAGGLMTIASKITILNFLKWTAAFYLLFHLQIAVFYGLHRFAKYVQEGENSK